MSQLDPALEEAGQAGWCKTNTAFLIDIFYLLNAPAFFCGGLLGVSHLD